MDGRTEQITYANGKNKYMKNAWPVKTPDVTDRNYEGREGEGRGEKGKDEGGEEWSRRETPDTHHD